MLISTVVVASYKEIDYVVPCFNVLHVRLTRIRCRIVESDQDVTDLQDFLINSSTITQAQWPELIVPIESCDISVSCLLYFPSQIEKGEESTSSKDPDAGSSIDVQSCETLFHTILDNLVDRLTSA